MRHLDGRMPHGFVENIVPSCRHVRLRMHEERDSVRFPG